MSASKTRTSGYHACGSAGCSTPARKSRKYCPAHAKQSRARMVALFAAQASKRAAHGPASAKTARKRAQRKAAQAVPAQAATSADALKLEMNSLLAQVSQLASQIASL